jgi:transposase InsO family protein
MVHRCFAHMGSNVALARAIDGGMLDGVPISSADLKAAAAESRCISCIEGKHTRLPFKSSETEAARPAQIIHSDIQGPMPESKDGYVYWISYLDDYSNMATVRLLKKKAEAGGITKDAIPLLERVGGGAVEFLQTDNGGEYFSGELDSWLKERGIIHHSSMAYTPQQNGKAERLNRPLMDSVRAMLADSDLPDKEQYWDEALSCAVRAYNCLP